MADMVGAAVAVCQSEPLDPSRGERSRRLDQLLAELRACVTESGWTGSALEKHMKKGESYVNRVLNGEKPMSVDFLSELPDDVLALWHSRRTEASGAIVVQPLSGDAAMRSLVAGLVGVMAARLPVKAGSPLKVTLATREERRTA